MDGEGSIIIADYGNHKVRKITTDGTVSTLAGSGSIMLTEGDFPPDLQAVQKQHMTNLLLPHAFLDALTAIPADDWGRTWAADRTIVLRRTSKTVKQQLDKMRLPAIVRLRTGISYKASLRLGTNTLIMSDLTNMVSKCLLTTVVLDFSGRGDKSRSNWTSLGELTCADVARFARVLAQCPALQQLELTDIWFKCPAQQHHELDELTGLQGGLYLYFAPVLGQCTALTHLNLRCTQSRCTKSTDRKLFCSAQPTSAGHCSINSGLVWFPALVHLDLSKNYFATNYFAAGAAEAGSEVCLAAVVGPQSEQESPRI